MEKLSNLNFYGVSLEKGDVTLYSNSLSEEISSRIDKAGCVQHPVNTYLLEKMANADPTHRACIDIKAMMTVGLGYDFLSKKAKRNKKFKEFIETPNENRFQSFQDLVDALAIDFFTFENGYLEMIKLNGNYAIYHLNGKNTYVNPKKVGENLIPGMASGYTQIVNGGKTTEFMALKRGQQMVEGKHYVAHLYKYSPSSSYYGVPSYISATPNISENVLIRQHGIRFFSNSARPDIALLISNGDITDEEIKKIQKQVSDYHKGVDNAHRLFIFSIEGEGAKVELKEISKTIDGQFLKESEKNRDEIARIHQVPPKILGISSAGSLGSGSETIGALKTFVETCINPYKKQFEVFINKVLESLFGFNPEIQFKQIDLTNRKDDAIIATMLSKIVDINGKPAATVDEIREDFGKPEDPKGALMPIPKPKPNPVDATGKPKPGVELDQQDKIESFDEEQPNPKED